MMEYQAWAGESWLTFVYILAQVYKYSDELEFITKTIETNLKYE